MCSNMDALIAKLDSMPVEEVRAIVQRCAESAKEVQNIDGECIPGHDLNLVL